MTDGFVVYGNPTTEKRRGRKHRVFVGLVAFMLSASLGVGVAQWFNILSSTVSDSGRAKFGAATTIDPATFTSGMAPANAEIVGTVLPGDLGKAVTVKFNNTSASNFHLLELHANQSGSFGAVTGQDGSCRSGQLSETYSATTGEYTGDISTHAQLGLSILLPANTVTTVTVPGFIDVADTVPISCANGVITVTVNALIGA